MSFDPEMSEWGNPPSYERVHLGEFIAYLSERRELKHLSTCRNRNQLRDTESSGERNWYSPNHGALLRGVVGPLIMVGKVSRMFWKEQS